MSPRTLSIIAVILSTSITGGTLYYRRHKQEYEAEALRYENARMKFQAYQRLHPQPATPAPAKAGASDEAKKITLRQKSALHYRNEGQATPQAALQTFVWACDQGDVELVAKLLFFEPEDRKKAEAFFATLPEPVRAKWKSVDEMAATLLIVSSMARSFPAADVLEATTMEPLSEKRAACRVPYPVQFQQADGVWRYVVTAAALEKLERETASTFGTKLDS